MPCDGVVTGPRVSTLLLPVISLIMSKDKMYTTEVFLPLSLKQSPVEEYSSTIQFLRIIIIITLLLHLSLFSEQSWPCPEEGPCARKKNSFHCVANCMNGSSYVNTWPLQTEQIIIAQRGWRRATILLRVMFWGSSAFFKWPTEKMTLSWEDILLWNSKKKRWP